jgi:hypothetical protein
LQFAKAGSAATLPQQEKDSSADVQLDSFIPRGDGPSTGFNLWPITPRRTFFTNGEYKLD